MGIKDRFMEIVLTAKDRLMNFVTGGLWERVRGEVRWQVMKVKE